MPGLYEDKRSLAGQLLGISEQLRFNMFELISLEQFKKQNKSPIAQKVVELAIRHKEDAEFYGSLVHQQYNLTMVDYRAVEVIASHIEADLSRISKKRA